MSRVKNALERSMVLTPGNEIGVKDLPEEVATGKGNHTEELSTAQTPA